MGLFIGFLSGSLICISHFLSFSLSLVIPHCLEYCSYIIHLKIGWSDSSKFILLQFSSFAQLCPALWDLMVCSTPGFPVHHQLPELAQTHGHRVGDAILPSHPLSSLSLPAFNLSQHQGLFQRVSSSHEMAKILEQQLQHQSFQLISIHRGLQRSVF